MIFILGFVAMIVPGRASLNFYTASSETAFNSAVTGLTAPYSLEDFTPSFSGSDYTDSTSAAQFLGFTGTNGTGLDQMVVTTGTTVLDQSTGNAFIEIIDIPANTYAVGVNISSTGSGFFCAQANVTSFSTSNCENGSPSGTGTVYVSSSSNVQFMGVMSSDTPITNFWIGSTGASAPLQINSFELFTEDASAPETSTFLLLGSGLILLGGFRRYRRGAALS